MSTRMLLGALRRLGSALFGLAVFVLAPAWLFGQAGGDRWTRVIFEDSARRDDSNAAGPLWREYTLHQTRARAEESPWRLNNNSLWYEAVGAGEYVEDFIETVDTFPVDNVRVEFEFRGEAGTMRGYVGPTVWWSADAKYLAGAGNVSAGSPPIGVQATYRWENKGTRGVTLHLGGSTKDHPAAVFAGLNEPRFARHVMTVSNGRMTYEAPGFPSVTYDLPSAPARGERRHLTLGARLYDAGDVQVLEFRNVRITTLADAEPTQPPVAPGPPPVAPPPPPQPAPPQPVPPPATRGIQTGPRVDVVSVAVPPAGGTVSVRKPGDPLDGFTIDVPAGSYAAATNFAVSYQPIVGHALGRGVTPISPLITVENGDAYADGLMKVTIPVTVPDGYFAMGFFYDRATGKLEGMPLLALRADAVTVATRHFSSFLISMIPLAELDRAILDGTTSGFLPGLDDWQFTNRGSYIEPDGHCAGQSMTAMWYYVTRPDGPDVHLWNRYDRNGDTPATPKLWEDDSSAYRFASVIQHELDWANWQRTFTDKMGEASDALTLRAFAYAIYTTGEPQYVRIKSSAGGGHAMVAFMVKNSTLYIADPNYPGAKDRRIVFDTATGRFNPYHSGKDADAIAAGDDTVYESIRYIAKSAMIDWRRIGARWKMMLGGAVGDTMFPAYEVFWVDDKKVWTPLVDGAVIDRPLAAFVTKVAGANASGWKVFFGGSRADTGPGGALGFSPKPGRHEVGVAVFGKPPGKIYYEFVDFKYFNISIPEPPAAPPPEPSGLCNGVTVEDLKRGPGLVSMSILLCSASCRPIGGAMPSDEQLQRCIDANSKK